MNVSRGIFRKGKHFRQGNAEESLVDAVQPRHIPSGASESAFGYSKSLKMTGNPKVTDLSDGLKGNNMS